MKKRIVVSATIRHTYILEEDEVDELYPDVGNDEELKDEIREEFLDDSTPLWEADDLDYETLKVEVFDIEETKSEDDGDE